MFSENSRTKGTETFKETVMQEKIIKSTGAVGVEIKRRGWAD